MKPLTYDFPHRLRGLPSAERELDRIARSLSVATRRGDKATADYLARRHDRAHAAYRVLRSRIRAATSAPAGEPTAADLTQGDRWGGG